MQINKQTLISPLALIGLLIVMGCLDYYKKTGLTDFLFLGFIIGISLCVCALVLTFPEQGNRIRTIRNTLLIIIGFGIFSIALMGLPGDSAIIPAMVRPVLFFAGIACICIGLYLSYKDGVKSGS